MDDEGLKDGLWICRNVLEGAVTCPPKLTFMCREAYPHPYDHDICPQTKDPYCPRCAPVRPAELEEVKKLAKGYRLRVRLERKIEPDQDEDEKEEAWTTTD